MKRKRNFLGDVAAELFGAFRGKKTAAASSPKASKRKKPSHVKGYRIWEEEPGDWRTTLDPGSSFDSYADAAQFIRSWRGRNPLRVSNPAVCGGYKPVTLITDRAKRYRANAPGCRPAGPKRCLFCGSRKSIDVHHLNGNEDDTTPDNLAWACRSCNSAIGAAYKRAGLGKRTRQYNPRKKGSGKSGVPSFAQYAAAVASHTRGRWDAGGQVIHATPRDVRREYAARIWELRRKRGTDVVPF